MLACVRGGLGAGRYATTRVLTVFRALDSWGERGESLIFVARVAVQVERYVFFLFCFHIVTFRWREQASGFPFFR